MLKAIRTAFGLSLVLALPISAQSVSVIDGNIFFHGKDGAPRQLTSSGLDSDPHLSKDGQLIVFVRETPSFKIDTGLGDVENNELWIAETAGGRPPRRVLVGRPGGFREDESLVLAGFAAPQFSPDKRRIYFSSTVWATSPAVWMLDLATGQTGLLAVGFGPEVLQRGNYAGHVIVRKNFLRLTPGRVLRYVLLDPDGKEVGEIGESEANLEEFREMYDVQQK